MLYFVPTGDKKTLGLRIIDSIYRSTFDVYSKFNTLRLVISNEF
jgi:hypothetical protein